MIDYWFITIAFTIFAGLISLKKSEEFCTPGKLNLNLNGKIFFIILFVTIVLFQATRTSYNDTITYSQSFYDRNPSDSILETLTKPYGGYFVIEIIVRRFTANYNIHLLICSLLINIGFIRFIFKYSKSLSQTLLLFFIGNFLFSMGGMKQAIAMSFLLISIDLYIQEKKLLSIIPIIIGYLFHPYIIVMIIIPFLSKKALSIKTLIVAILVLIAFFNLDIIFSLFAEIGNDYSVNNFDNYTINPLRVIIEFIPLAIMIYSRRSINQTKNKLLIMGVNMYALSWFFIFLALFINPIYPGRLAQYYAILYAVIMPEVLDIAFKNNRYKGLICLVFYLIMMTYFLFDITKIGKISLNYDRFHHISILQLFRR